MENVILVVILLGIVAGIVWYLLRAKKRGETCIGCPYAKRCKNGKSMQGGSPCHADKHEAVSPEHDPNQ